MAEGQICHAISKDNLFAVESIVVLFSRRFYDKMIGLDCLDDDTPFLQPASRTTSHLRHQLKRLFRRAKFACSEKLIGGQNRRQRHVMKVVSFGDHLRSDENVRLMAFKGV